MSALASIAYRKEIRSLKRKYGNIKKERVLNFIKEQAGEKEFNKKINKLRLKIIVAFAAMVLTALIVILAVSIAKNYMTFVMSTVARQAQSFLLGKRTDNTDNSSWVDNPYTGRIPDYSEYIPNIENGRFTALETPWNVTSENLLQDMVVASTCLVGKVTYVTGGGHMINALEFEGVLPTWIVERDAYVKYGYSKYYYVGTYISDVVLVHKEDYKSPEPADSSSFIRKDIHNIRISTIEDYVKVTNFNTELFSQLKYNTDRKIYTGAVGSKGELTVNKSSSELASFIGMDCSSFCSWILNQATNKPTDVARKYKGSYGMITYTPEEYDYNFQFGDVFNYEGHVVFCIGKVGAAGDGVCIVVEMTPPTIKFTVVIADNYNQTSYSSAIAIAKEANLLIGNLDSVVYTYRLSTMKDLEINRLSSNYDDYNKIVTEYNKRIIDMNAVEIIQYGINKMGRSYLWGVERHNSKYFKAP